MVRRAYEAEAKTIVSTYLYDDNDEEHDSSIRLPLYNYKLQSK